MLQNYIEENNAEGFELALSQIIGDIGEKLEGYAMVLKNIESDIAGIKSEEKDWQIVAKQWKVTLLVLKKIWLMLY